MGPVISPIESPVESPTEEEQFVIHFNESFEGDDGDYYLKDIENKVVEESRNNPTFSGEHSLRLQRKQFAISYNEDISNYSFVKIDFKYYSKGMENNEDYFIIEFKFNGSPWTEVGKWIKGQDFNNKNWEDASVIMATNNKRKLKFRIKAQANQRND